MSAAPERDAAEVGRLDAVLPRLLPALAGVPAGGAVPELDRPLPDRGVGVQEVVAELGNAAAHGCGIGAPGFTGYITTSGTTSAVAAALATAASGGQRYFGHAFNTLEHVALRWLAELCALPPSWQGVLSSGGSTANLLALGAARQWAYEQVGADVGRDGLPAGRPGRIYVSVEAHRTIHRAAGVLGLGRGSVRELPVDARRRLDVRALDDALVEDLRAGVLPIAVVGIAGTTNTGAVDPLADVVDVARRHGAWVHVDGAYGLPAVVDPEVAPLLEPARDADSAIVDPHKWLATGVGVGATYVRDAAVLHRAFREGESPYLEGTFDPAAEALSPFDGMAGPWADLSVELSAPPRGPAVWAVLREIGRDGMRDRVRRHRGYARHVAERARRHPRLELLDEPQLSIACFRYRPADGGDLDALNGRILQRLRRETPFVPSSTVVSGALALRPCYINPRTTQADVDGLVDAVVRLGDEEIARRRRGADRRPASP